MVRCRNIYRNAAWGDRPNGVYWNGVEVSHIHGPVFYDFIKDSKTIKRRKL